MLLQGHLSPWEVPPVSAWHTVVLIKYWEVSTDLRSSGGVRPPLLARVPSVPRPHVCLPHLKLRRNCVQTTGRFLPCPRPSGPMPELRSRASLPSFQALVISPSYPGGKPLRVLTSSETDQFEESWLASKIRPIFSTPLLEE